MERLSELPNGPDEAGHLVGNGDSRLVVTATLLDIKGPEAESIRIGFGLSSPQHGTGTVNQQHAKIDVTLFADPTESPPAAAGMFARREAEIAGKVAA